MKSILNTPVGQIVARDYRTSQILRSHGLDFCCGGSHSLEEACEKKGIDAAEVAKEIHALDLLEDREQQYNEWSLDFLVDYIINTHHEYVRKMLPELNYYAQKVARVHGERDQELYDILQKVQELQREMTGHLQKEEEALFPGIKELVQQNTSEGIGEELVAALEDEHDKAGALMRDIESLTHGFEPPEHACASYQVLFKSLKGFQQDLHKHVHLENNILFPKALELKQRLN